MTNEIKQNSEQISFDFASSPALEAEEIIQEKPDYEPLDQQLADLLQELNQSENQILSKSTLALSKQTREGNIALHCSPDQQAELLKTKVVGESGQFKPLILENNYLYLRRYWQYQKQLFDQILSRSNQEDISEENQAWQQKRLDHYFKNDTQEGEINWQQKAAESALKNNFLIISGGPGTGKTTTIARILSLLIEQHIKQNEKTGENRGGGSFSILLAAPTGKASIRMLDSIRDAQHKMQLDDELKKYIPTQASTIHKLLGYIPDSITFKHNLNNPLKADVVLIDEASMIDIAMMSKLIEAVPKHAKLILIGDKDQLSSVETGSVFTDICKGLKNSSNLVTLQKNWRFSKDSGIGQLAIAANSGDTEKVLDVLKTDNHTECQLLSPSLLNAKQIPTELIIVWNKYFEVLKNPHASIDEIFEAFNEYRILCALRKGLNGSIILSDRIETTLEKQGLINSQQGKKTGQNTGNKWYHGRPIMISQNSYSKGLFNGDTGITLIRDGQLQVYFQNMDKDSKEGLNATSHSDYKSYAPVRLPAHETAWAMTIHKSQGSEFNQVMMILPHEVMPLLSRQLIYTGVTRAKQKVSLMALEEVLIAGVKTEVVQATQINKMLRDKFG